MIRISIYWQDLSKKMQNKLLSVFGDNCNWDCFPIATLELEDDRQILIDGLLGDELE